MLIKTIHRIQIGIIAFAAMLALTAPSIVTAAPGDIDTGYNPTITTSFYVLATAVQPDGKTIIAGSFSSVNGVPRSNIARLNPDGSLDMGFNPKANNNVNCVVVQADGKILLGGEFTALQPNGASAPTTRNYIGRVNSDGSLDASFNPNADNLIYSIGVQVNGMILLGGEFTSLGDATRNRIGRVDSDGNLDSGFDPRADGHVRCIALQADGKILLAGNFSSLRPNGAAFATTRRSIARINTNGSLDMGFDPNPLNGDVKCVAAQADGKILLMGGLQYLQPNGAVTPTPRSYAARVNADGSLDTGFDPKANGAVYSMTVQADGKILLGGEFTSFQPNGAASPATRNYIGRVNATGSLDAGFNPNANSTVYSVSVQVDGKILLGGNFTTLNAMARHKFARLNNDSVTQSLAVPDATQVQWQRGGASPEISQVSFEKSIDSGEVWTPIGNGTRVGTTSNWQLTGLSLPITGQVRARARTAGGQYNGSSGLVETAVTYTANPDIGVTQSSPLTDGMGSVAFGNVKVGTSSAPLTFTITNFGIADLTLGTITKDGTSAGEFTVNTIGMLTNLTTGNSTTFSIAFMPGAPGSGIRTAAIHIASNDPDENTFDIALTGAGLTATADTDGDGLNDWAEAQYAPLGFDWQVGQTVLVNTLFSSLGNAQANVNAAGYYSPAQVQALNVGTPLIQRNPMSGIFTLTIGVEKSSDLSTFNPFPMTVPQTLINGQGKLEFQFTVPDNAAFFQLRAQ